MSFARLVWALGGAGCAVVVGAAALGACSSSSSGNPASQDSGAAQQDSASSSDTGTVEDGGTGTEASSMGDDSSSPVNDSGGTCEKPPTLFKESTPGVYCPFSAVDGGKNLTCAAGEHCCETPSGSATPSTCVAMGTPCPVTGSVDWQCEEAIDCTVTGAAGPICCGTGSPTTATHCGVTWAEWTNFTGTKCATSCPAPGITVCEQTSDCTGDAGSTCTPSKANGNDFGFCTP